MKYRALGRTGWQVSEVSIGTWQVGGGWRVRFDDAIADRILKSALDEGINFIDTADVYYDGLSERAVGKVVREHGSKIYVATKCGRKIRPHTNEEYTPERLVAFVEESLSRLGLEQIDLIQLHCPPPEVYHRDEIFTCFDRLKREGKIAHLGVSVESIEEAHQAIGYPNVVSVQIIYNMFRQRPREQFFPAAAEKNVAIIVRVPLASGLLSGKLTSESKFAPDDHRHFNREGKAFDKGETFSGVPYDVGLAAVEELRPSLQSSGSMVQCALRWILDSPQVSCIIPGASKVEQVAHNCGASELPSLTSLQHQEITRIYDAHIREHVHHLW